MKILPLSLSFLSLGFGVLLAPDTFAQGTLTPPGAPAPTMRTLDQVEPRTIVNVANTPGDATNSFILTKPGSYYLTGNITGVAGKNGISIQAADVTLDLNGFTLTGRGTDGTNATGLRGVIMSATATNSCIRNGSARNWYVGVEATAAGLLVERLRVSGNLTGLSLGNGSIVRDCAATGNTTGFLCGDRTQLTDCIATENTGIGFDCRDFVSLLDCTASRNFGAAGIQVLGSGSVIHCSSTRNIPDGKGIDVGVSCSVINCVASSNGSEGITANIGSSIVDSTASDNSAIGILVSSFGVVRGCTAHGNKQYGIFAYYDCRILANTSDANGDSGIGTFGKGNQIDGNSCNANASYGIAAFDCLVTRNSVRNNTLGSYLFPANLIIIKTSGVAFPPAVSPWANFEY